MPANFEPFLNPPKGETFLSAYPTMGQQAEAFLKDLIMGRPPGGKTTADNPSIGMMPMPPGGWDPAKFRELVQNSALQEVEPLLARLAKGFTSRRLGGGGFKEKGVTGDMGYSDLRQIGREKVLESLESLKTPEGIDPGFKARAGGKARSAMHRALQGTTMLSQEDQTALSRILGIQNRMRQLAHTSKLGTGQEPSFEAIGRVAKMDPEEVGRLLSGTGQKVRLGVEGAEKTAQSVKGPRGEHTRSYPDLATLQPEEQGQMMDKMRDKLNQLEVGKRQLFLKWIENPDFASLSKEVGMPPKTISRHIDSALKTMGLKQRPGTNLTERRAAGEAVRKELPKGD